MINRINYYLIDVTCCPICVRQYGDRVRLIQHLADHKSCGLALTSGRFPKLSDAEFERLRDVARTSRSNAAKSGRWRKRIDTYVPKGRPSKRMKAMHTNSVIQPHIDSVIHSQIHDSNFVDSDGHVKPDGVKRRRITGKRPDSTFAVVTHATESSQSVGNLPKRRRVTGKSHNVSRAFVAIE